MTDITFLPTEAWHALRNDIVKSSHGTITEEQANELLVVHHDIVPVSIKADLIAMGEVPA
jgi:hypothetical protein